MAPKVAARVARDPRQLRLAEAANGVFVVPPRALSERINVALAAGAQRRGARARCLVCWAVSSSFWS